MDTQPKLERAMEYIIDGRISDALQILLEASRTCSTSVFEQVAVLNSELKRHQDDVKLGVLNQDGTIINRITKTAIGIISSIGDEIPAFVELASKEVMEYPHIPKAVFFNRSNVFLRGKNGRLFLWAAGSDFFADMVISNEENHAIITINILVFNYQQSPFTVMNFSKSEIQILRFDAKKAMFKSIFNIFADECDSYIYDPVVVSVNNDKVENDNSHYFTIPPYGFIVIRNSYDITPSKEDVDKLNFRNLNLFNSVAEILNLSINLTNYIDDEIILEPFE